MALQPATTHGGFFVLLARDCVSAAPALSTWYAALLNDHMSIDWHALKERCTFLKPFRQELRGMNPQGQREQECNRNGEHHKKVVAKLVLGVIRWYGTERAIE